MKIKIISAILAFTMIATPTLAETWITVSSWAYNDVSNFKKEGMLPESLDSESDFTKPITRLQLAQILHSALTNVADTSIKNIYSSNQFCDTNDESANYLYWRRIITGERSNEYDENGIEKPYFYPDRLLTREEMAVIADRTIEWFLGNDMPQKQLMEISDISTVSNWAVESVKKMVNAGIMSGVGDGIFSPKDNLTIEQAISIVYRLYNLMPTGQTADGAGIDANEETVVQTYTNGITETKKDNKLFLRQDENILMEFETDIYSNIFCETVDGTLYAAAQNCYGKTDIYNLVNHEITAKIPYPIYSVDKEYITAKSSVIYSGLSVCESAYEILF